MYSLNLIKEKEKIKIIARTTIGANTANVSSSGFVSIHTLPVAFGYLKIIEKQQPKYVDKLTPHITKLLQKLIKDHTSAGVDYNPAFTEYIIECLTLLKYRIGQLTSDLRKQFMNNFLPCLIEKSHDITLVRAIIRLVYDWLKWRGDVQLVPSLKEKSQLLLKLLQCIDKSGRFHQQQTNDNDLTNSFLELILHVYQESNYRELCIKLEAAFILGLKSTNQQLRKQFFLILDKNLRKTLHDRLLFIFLSQNWEYLGQHYWIKQCLELFYTCVSSTIPLSIIDNRTSVLPALTSVIKSGEFYDRYDFMIDYVKTKNPSAIENIGIKTEPNSDVTIKMEVNDETSTQNPAYSIISNALGVTAMSTIVTKKQRSTSISLNESKAKHFKRTISFENIRRLSVDKLPEKLQRESSNQIKLTELINDEINFLKILSSIQLKPNDLFDSIIQFLHTNNSIVIDKLAHYLFIDLLPRILRVILEKYRIILFQQIIQPFFVSGTHLQQRDLYPYSSLNTLLEAFYVMFKTNNNLSEFVPIIRPIILKYIAKTHNTWHRSILLLEQYILDQQPNNEFLTNDETYIESLNSLSELYEHLNEDDYNISLWLHRQYSPNIKQLVSNALQYEQLGLFQQALEHYTQSIKLLDTNQKSSSSSSTSTLNRFSQVDEYSFLEQHWIKCTKELNQWETLMSYCKQQSNRDHLLYLDCIWRSSNWPLMKETLGQLDAMCNGTNINLTNSSIQTFQFLNPNPTLTQSTIISNILTIKDFQWKFALYRCYLTLCSTITNTDDPTIYQTTMNITERLIDYCSLNALKEWKHLPNYISNSHLNLLQASQRIIELQESAQILLNIQTNTNNNNTSTSIISTTTNGNTSTTTTNIRQTTNIHEFKTIVKTWKSRLPLINDPLSYWNDIFTWREIQYSTISSQFDKDANGTNLSSGNNLNNSSTNTGQVLLGIHAVAQSITQLAKIARKHHIPNICMEILSRIGTVIPSVPVVDSYQKIKQIIKCYLVLFPTLSSNDIQDIFDIIEQANTKYFNKDMMSEFYSLKAVAYSKLNRNDEAQKLFSCATQLSDTNLTRIWINWGDFLLKQSSIINDDESIIICYLNACKDLTEIKARSILSKIFYLLSHDNENNNNNKLSICIERYLSLIPVQHWLFWLPQIMNKLIRNESSQCMLAILNELIRLYPQAVYVQIKKFLRKLIENKHDEKLIPSTPITPTIDINLNLPTISYRQQAINNLNRLEQILLGQHPTIVRILDIIIEQLNTINETLFEYIIKRLYQCQRKIYEDLFENKKDLSEDVKQIIQHLKDILNNDNNEYKNIQPIKIQFSNDFNESVLNTTQISRSFILLINKWITLIERRIEQTEPRIKYLNQIKYLQLLSFNSQITNDINMPGELWHAPEANFYFRINKFFPTIERIFKHERYFNRLTIRAHNGKIMYYLLSNNYQTISYDKINSQWELEENTLQFLKMINNICIRKEKELLKRHMQIFLPHLCTYLPSLRLIEDNRLTINLIEIYNNRLMLPIRKYYELIDDNNDNLLNIYQLIQNEFFSNKYLLHQWTLNEYTNATGYFSFRKIFTISMSFYSTLNYLFGFYMYTNNQLSIQRSIGNINPLYLRLQYNLNKQDENIFLTPNIDTFINRFGKMGSFIATILATLTSLAQPKFQIIEYLKIFYKEDIHIKHPELTQKECVELVENIARQLETKLNQFTDIDISKRIVSELVENSTDINQLSRLNPLYYPWL
ncbi:unnamed protein product [Rotaria sp. Silwood1]|nr:unnamed protein product [Rotaria sp. Silwood1]CAF1207193.1 unnamed protein product [Rotaria sp. Silwood1]CAF3440120.1 unnamed protein product [Rotaria sp. Silwood1]CAF4555633.1 unnamed protein product [Rotaria sp. Silwood1]